MVFKKCKKKPSPSCFHELLGTLEGPCVETSRSNPRNTPNTLRAMLDSGIFGSVRFPLCV